MFKPIRDVIIVKKSDSAEKTKGGIYIPATVENKEFFSGVVMAVGSGILTESGKVVELEVKVGDTVVYGKSGSLGIQIQGDDYVMMRESNILGVE